MCQVMFRQRGRPPEQLPIGGYENQNEQETEQIPVHQPLVPLEEPRQLPLPSVREFEQDVVMQQENDAGNNPYVQPMFEQQSSNIPISQDRRVANNPLQAGKKYEVSNRRRSADLLNCSIIKGIEFLVLSLDMKVNPEMDFTVDERQEQAKTRLAEENPLILLGAPPCTVFSSMQNINAKHNIFTCVCGILVIVIWSIEVFHV